MTAPTFRIGRFVWLLLGALIVGFVLYQLRSALLPFIVGGALAYILNPLVLWLEDRIPWMSNRPALKRMLIIALIFLIAFIIAVAALIIGVTVLIREIEAFINDLPELIESSRATFESINRQFAVSVPPEVSAIVRDVMQNLGGFLVTAGSRLLVSTIGIISETASILLGLLMVPLVLFYMLKDRGQIIEGALRSMPPVARRHTVNVLGLLNGVFSAYIRGQLILGLIVGVVIFIGLWLLGIPFSPVLGLIAGLFELIPVIGPWIGAIPGLIVVLAVAPEKFVWVALLYIGVQLVQNSLLVPRIQSASLNLHPVMILAALLVGSEVAGLWGIILGPPLAAGARSVYLYFVDQWWGKDIEDAEKEQPVEGAEEATEPVEAD